MDREMTVSRALELAVEIERFGVKFYERVARKFDDNPDVARVFRGLAEDEKEHESRFADLLEQAGQDDPEAASEYHRSDFLRALAKSEFFRTPDFKEIDSIVTVADALRIGIKLELRTLLYYQGVRDEIGHSKLLDAAIAEEQEHFVLLQDELIKNVG
ncbi:MAG: ferritin family protein [Deltaproteobacteria bacterium]|nr:ferritin family protein [Deltaproteobacteria bacterium]